MAPKTVLITGCSAGGIGSALAVAFQERGFRVFATARNVSKMDDIAKLPNVTLLALDVTSRPSLDAAAAAVRKETGGTLDVLVNNAGVAYTTPVVDADVKSVRNLFDANFFGTLETTIAFAPLLIAAQGTIVNICSTAAHVDVPWMALYGASKAAQEQLSEGLRLELRPYGVKVLSVVAGAVTTNMAASSAPFHLPEGAFFKASKKEVARQAAGEGIAPGMPADVFAKKVVADVLGGVTGRVYRGSRASFVWFFSSFFPQGLQDKLIMAMQGSRFERAL